MKIVYLCKVWTCGQTCEHAPVGTRGSLATRHKMTTKMKIYTIIFFVLILIIGCTNNVEKRIKYGDFENDWERDYVFGQVRSIKQYKANVIDFESGNIEEPIIEYKKNYTNFGKVIDHEIFDNFGKLIQLTKNEYNNKEQRVKSISENYLIPSKTIETAVYNEKGEQIIANIVMDDTLNFKAMLDFDNHGNLVSQINNQNGDSTSMSFEYKYNDRGNILWKKQIEKSEFGTNEYINEFKYDQFGNLIELFFKSELSGDMKSIYEYDQKNRIKKVIQYKLGQIENETLFDKYYNQILVKYYNEGTLNKEMKYEYVFDSNGNWVERKAFIKENSNTAKKFILIFVETRKIEYY